MFIKLISMNGKEMLVPIESIAGVINFGNHCKIRLKPGMEIEDRKKFLEIAESIEEIGSKINSTEENGRAEREAAEAMEAIELAEKVLYKKDVREGTKW